MKIVPIFVAANLDDGGLFAIQYKTNEPDEYERLFDFWFDQETVFRYLQQNESYLYNRYFRGVTKYDIQQSIIDEAHYLNDYFIQLKEHDFHHSSHALQRIFRPLDNREYNLYVWQPQKAWAEGRWFRRQYLRLYAIRLQENLFVVTGGAIKLAYRMEDHPDLKKELVKIERVRKFLKENNISTADDIVYYYDNFE